MLGGGGMATVQAPFSNTRCRQMVSKILIFWKWVLPWLCLISAFQTPTSYKWNDTGPFAFYAVNRVLRFGFWQSEFGFQIVKVPVFRHNNLLQNPTYCKIQPTSPYSKLFIYCQKYKSNIKMLQSLCSQSTCLTKASVSLNVLTQNGHWVLFLFYLGSVDAGSDALLEFPTSSRTESTFKIVAFRSLPAFLALNSTSCIDDCFWGENVYQTGQKQKITQRIS